MVKLRGLVAAASLSLGCCIPGGVPVEGSYPGLTPKILASLEQKVLGSVEAGARVVQDAGDYPPGEAVVSFAGAPKEYINYFVEFTDEDYYSKGISVGGLAGLDIAIVSPAEVSGICGDSSLACNAGSTIVMPDDLGIIGFFSVFSHEFGHHLFYGNAEYPAVANETYGSIKSYQFSRRIGSLMLDYGLRFPSMYSVDSTFPLFRMYHRGAVFAALNLAEHRGDIEAAMDDVSHSKFLEIETRLERKLDEHPGMDYDDVYFGLWMDVLDDVAFYVGLVSDTGHLGMGESLELIGYLKALDYGNYLMLSGDVLQQYYALLGEFDEQRAFANPYFRANVVLPLTRFLHYDLHVSLERRGVASAEVYGYARRIIEVNGDYPCYVADPFECPFSVREPRSSHLDAYYFFVRNAFVAGNADRKKESGAYVRDFIGRFFPGADFDSGNFDAIGGAGNNVASVYLPPMAVLVGRFAMDRGEYGEAERFFNAGLAANCVYGGSAVSPQLCEQSKGDIARLLEELEELGNGQGS